MAIWHHERMKVNLLALLFVSFKNLFSFLFGKLGLLTSVQIDFLERIVMKELYQMSLKWHPNHKRIQMSNNRGEAR